MVLIAPQLYPSKSLTVKKETITGAELAEKLKMKNLIPENNGEDWMLPVKENSFRTKTS